MSSDPKPYKSQCGLCGGLEDATRIYVTVGYGDFYNVVTDDIDHIEGLWVECADCIKQHGCGLPADWPESEG